MKTRVLSQSPNLEEAKKFYEKLGFQRIHEKDAIIYTDGNLSIELSKEKWERSGLKLYAASWEKELIKLRKKTNVLEKDGMFILRENSGAWIYLIEEENALDVPANEAVQTYIGSSVGYSLEVLSIPDAMKIWEILGFQKVMGDEDAKFIVMSNVEGFSISMMAAFTCPHSFYNPSLSYFAGGKNLERINNLRALNFEFTEEIDVFNSEGIVDNVIIKDPGGLGFFVFND